MKLLLVLLCAPLVLALLLGVFVGWGLASVAQALSETARCMCAPCQHERALWREAKGKPAVAPQQFLRSTPAARSRRGTWMH